ncbi:hypothetical protein [Methylibium petroleiphilum]|uniref:Uncharacterized protein n=1 Tax=Methylibium petroleiphilum (strain ATCC BAA-1232 / LMG 22953 / PM1) TaxID=420662 RepID=A2SN50_METPP|nr:hypothetical protein [Methylibium petroleiphilum]ABM96989.1 hypothetical protein Mpe_B0214 [Methylibium petroleiphilum PM1]
MTHAHPSPCPFCGAELERTGDGQQWRHPGSLMLPDGCLLRGRRIDDDEQSLAQWNRRVPAAEAQAC